MSAVEIIGTVSGTILGLPQVLRLVRTGRVDGLSLTAWQAMLVVNLIWTAHGISIGQAPQIVTSAQSVSVPILYLMARELQRHLLPVLLPGLLAAGALIAVDHLLGSASARRRSSRLSSPTPARVSSWSAQSASSVSRCCS